MAWFRSPKNLEEVDYERINLDTPLVLPGNAQHQPKKGLKFFARDRDVVHDWNNAYFNVEYRFEALADGTNIANSAETAPVSGFFH